MRKFVKTFGDWLSFATRKLKIGPLEKKTKKTLYNFVRNVCPVLGVPTEKDT